jgi:hypothetical protein
MANMSYGGAQGSSYYDLARKGQVFIAQAIITAPVGFGTAAGTGGPLLWNGTGGTTSVAAPGGGTYNAPNAAVDAVILGLSWGVTTAETTTNIAVGLTGGPGQTAAPSAPTAIDGVACTRISSSVTPACNVYRVGTVAAAGKWFFPLFSFDTTAVTAMPHQPNYEDLAGMFVVPPGSWISVAASATGTAGVLQIGLVWAEIPRL